MSLDKYRRAQSVTETPRQTEYRVFAQVTRGLMEADGKYGTVLHQAVQDNLRLWLTLQTDLSSAENRLPDDLKARLISISIWVHRHTSMVMRGEAQLEPLITVNRSIMEGLAQNPA